MPSRTSTPTICLDSQVAIALFSHCCDRFFGVKCMGEKKGEEKKKKQKEKKKRKKQLAIQGLFPELGFLEVHLPTGSFAPGFTQAVKRAFACASNEV